MSDICVGIVGTGVYIPEMKMTAKEIAEATGGNWTEESIIQKLGITEKSMPSKDDGTQEMAVKAALDCLKNTQICPKEINVILCIGEEWKEYPLTTSALYIQDKIGAINSWGIDVQNRCATTVTALKMAKDMLIADDEINTIMVVGGYRNCDFVNYSDSDTSMMFNLSAGAGAIILKKNYPHNILLGSHIIADGSLSRHIGVEIGGHNNPITEDNIQLAYKSLKILNPILQGNSLNDVSLLNWMECIDKAFKKSRIDKKELGYLAALHVKRSMYNLMIEELGITQEQSIYLENYGHMGQIDQILSLHLALKEGRIKDGTIVSMVAAGIGFIWAANVIKWG